MMDALALWLGFLALLFVVPLILTVLEILRIAGRLWFRWRHVPLAQKNQTRAGAGAFLIVVAVGLAVYGSPVRDPFNGWGLAGLAGFGVLYFVVGVTGSQGASWDFMSLFWFSVLGLACAALLLHGIPV